MSSAAEQLIIICIIFCLALICWLAYVDIIPTEGTAKDVALGFACGFTALFTLFIMPASKD